jgi:hypothetical protein
MPVVVDQRQLEDCDGTVAGGHSPVQSTVVGEGGEGGSRGRSTGPASSPTRKSAAPPPARRVPGSLAILAEQCGTTKFFASGCRRVGLNRNFGGFISTTALASLTCDGMLTQAPPASFQYCQVP